MLTNDLLSVARGERMADLVLRNTRVINVFSGDKCGLGTVGCEIYGALMCSCD